MAFRVLSDKLDQAKLDSVQQYLWVTIANTFSSAPTEAINLFMTEDTPDGQVVVLPYYYGRYLFKTDLEVRLPRPVLPAIAPWTFKRELRPNQLDPVNTTIASLIQKRTASLVATTGSGKTIMSLYTASAVVGQHMLDYYPPVIICYTLDILEKQWENTVRDFTTATYAIFNAKTKKALDGKVDIYLCMVDAVKKLPDVVRKTCCLLILDEAHLFCTRKRLFKIMDIDPDYILPLTATPIKPNGMEIMMQMVAGKTSIPLANHLPITVWKMDTGIKAPMLLNKLGKPDWDEITKWLDKHEKRNEMIYHWIAENPTRKIAVMTKHVEHAHLIYEELKTRGESVSIMIGKVKSYQKCRVLILGIQKGGTGFDEASSCENYDPSDGRIDTIIICQSLKAPLIQVVGRSFRCTAPHIIHLLDQGPIFKNHWKEALLYYNSDMLQGGVKIHEIDRVVTVEN